MEETSDTPVDHLAFGHQVSVDPDKVQTGNLITLDPSRGFSKWMVFEHRPVTSDTTIEPGRYFIVENDVRAEVVEVQEVDGDLHLLTVSQGFDWDEGGFTAEDLERRLGDTLHPVARVDTLDAETREDTLDDKRELLEDFADEIGAEVE